MKQLAYVYKYFNHRRIRKIVGLSTGTAVTVAMIITGFLTYVKAKNADTGISFSMVVIIFFGIAFFIVAAKNFLDLLDLNQCEQFFKKMVNKMSIDKMIKLDMTNFFPDCKEEVYNQLLMHYVEGKRLYVKLEPTDFSYRMELQFFSIKDEKQLFTVWFTVDDYLEIEHIWRFIKEHIDS